MSAPELSVSRQAAGTLLIELSGEWLLAAVPDTADVERAVSTENGLRRIRFDTHGVTAWDSGLLIYLRRVLDCCGALQVDVERDGLPEGVRGLLDLAYAVPERASARREEQRPSFLRDVGTEAIDLVRAAGDFSAFLGQLVLASVRLATGRAHYRRSDLWLTIQEVGAQALPIVSLISFLFGLILAFVASAQLRQFGADILVANLVGLAMVREMGAMMSAIIMAGRTGAAFAAQIGTMNVNEEIDALRTSGFDPMEYLVVPRVLALVLMMPLLSIYANLMGILGGLAVGVGVMDLTIAEYLVQTRDAISIADLAGGVFKATVYGAIVAVAGCLRGLQCGRSSAAVGVAATAAVVTSVVFIVVASAILTIIYDVLGV